MVFEDIQTNFDAQKVPKSPGVYQFLAQNDSILYVGKAKILSHRIQSYFRKQGLAPKTQAMMNQAHCLKIIVTHNEAEALILENNLIKNHRPRYNILFRDDKSYPYVFLSAGDFPRLSYHRGAQNKKGLYFGPYPNAHAVHQSLRLIQKIFPVRQCEDSVFANRTRPCLQYQIKRCHGPCVGLISTEDYNKDVKRTIDFFKGHEKQLVQELEQAMTHCSESLEFEQAAQYRDQLSTLQSVMNQNQKVEGANSNLDADIVVTLEAKSTHLIYLAFIRNGKYLGGKPFLPKNGEGESSKAVLHRFLMQHYFATRPPKEILLSERLDQPQMIQSALFAQWQAHTQFKYSLRSERANWMHLATHNATLALSQVNQSTESAQQRLLDLQNQLQLPEPPTRMECFDISHTSGQFTKASCVVFENAQPLVQDYRRFNIEGIQQSDDYAAMRQVLERRYSRLLNEEGKLPDLIVIDGGKGQAKIALTIMQELGLTSIPMLCIAKGEARKSGEETFIWAHNNDTIDILPTAPAFHLLQYIRDEAHRFAISGHRKKRQKAMTQSRLEDIEGIGHKTRQRLITHFGGLKPIQEAAEQDLINVSGVSKALAKRIYDYYH